MAPVYRTPMNVKLGSKAASFHDAENQISLHGDQVATVKVMTDHVRQWLLAGGLEVVDEPVKKPEVSTEKGKGKGKGKGKEKPEGGDKPEGEGAEEESSVDELLQN